MRLTLSLSNTAGGSWSLSFSLKFTPVHPMSQPLFQNPLLTLTALSQCYYRANICFLKRWNVRVGVKEDRERVSSYFPLFPMFTNLHLQVSKTELIQNKEYGGLCSLYHNYIYIYIVFFFSIFVKAIRFKSKTKQKPKKKKKTQRPIQ